jgi:hypothetical protein
MEEKRSQRPGDTAREREEEISRGRGNQRSVGGTGETAGEAAGKTSDISGQGAAGRGSSELVRGKRQDK